MKRPKTPSATVMGMSRRGPSRHLRPQATELLDVILGRPTERVPHFEFFFSNSDIRAHYLGPEGSGGLPDGLALAIAIGWGSACAASFGLMHGRRSEVASDGTTSSCCTAFTRPRRASGWSASP